MYVRVKNRGTASATGVRVKAYHCNPGTGLRGRRTGADGHPGTARAVCDRVGRECVVGPFAWKPTAFAHECLLAIASATGDAGNDTTVMGAVSMRGSCRSTTTSASATCIRARNRLEEAAEVPREAAIPRCQSVQEGVKVELVAALPKVLTEKRMWVFFNSPGGHKFELGPQQERQVVFSVVDKPRITPRSPFPVVHGPEKPGIRRWRSCSNRRAATISLARSCSACSRSSTVSWREA